MGVMYEYHVRSDAAAMDAIHRIKPVVDEGLKRTGLASAINVEHCRLDVVRKKDRDHSPLCSLYVVDKHDPKERKHVDTCMDIECHVPGVKRAKASHFKIHERYKPSAPAVVRLIELSKRAHSKMKDALSKEKLRKIRDREIDGAVERLQMMFPSGRFNKTGFTQDMKWSKDASFSVRVEADAEMGDDGAARISIVTVAPLWQSLASITLVVPIEETRAAITFAMEAILKYEIPKEGCDEPY